MDAGLGRKRALLAALVVLSTAVLTVGYVDAVRQSDRITGDPVVEQAFVTGDRSPVVAPRENVTVVATDSNAFVADEGDGPRARSELVAFAPDGSIYYYEDQYTRYWDVDPVAGTTATVEFVYSEHLEGSDCDGSGACTRNGVDRVNLTTGERETIYERITPGKHSSRWHDVDRIDEERLLVADIDRDRVYIVNTVTDVIEWEWDAQAEYSIQGGGPWPDDWTHSNDVEYVEIDGQEAVMVSLRNQDQVAFVGLEKGLLEDWTLGADGELDTLYEQHNPDFIPAERGGPAVLIGDSENGRIVEYQWTGEGWEQSWEYADARITWPRDADRLPNGHTLVTDSNGDRVFELDEQSEIVWSADIGFPYESERLGTDDESSGGESAASLDLPSRSAGDDPEDVGLYRSVVPTDIQNLVSYAFPRWVGPLQLGAIVVLILSVSTWTAVEYRHRNVSVRLRWPVRFERR
ncbi:arylsulfotransferase family protein [Halanaeroarchaeum sp. HSR-CO]|uniref:arylsulfotransferase family protein n=1 Tax=Halanaeroarchaeum sp. HSR-CO TaxID=2866382 RepID=UPI00217D4CF5|nr:arylsulfotransferase family protein [Halanaeroarchaeum sp. HSR-CO]